MHLSVVIPCAHGSASVERTLGSLLAQDTPAHEVLLASNGDETASQAVAEAFAPRFDGRLRCVKAPEVLGPVELWNFAVAESTGEWVSLLTPQVTARPRFVRAMADSAERCGTAALIRAGWTRERSPGSPAEQHTLLSVRTITHPAEALYEQRFGPKASTAAAALRRSVWDAMGGFAPEITLLGGWIGDWALWLSAGALAETVRSPEIVADLHDGGLWRSKTDELQQMFRIYQSVLPKAAAAAQLPDPTWIAAASRKRFRDVAIAASNELPPRSGPERDAIARCLEPWARTVEQEPLLERLRAGEKVRSFTLGQKMKPALRRVVAAVR